MLIGESEDRAAVISYDEQKLHTSRGNLTKRINVLELTALCYFCGIAGELPQPSGVLIHSKPDKWSLIHGGTPRQPKRFFICAACVKVLCSAS